MAVVAILESDKPNRVLTPQLGQRLATVTDAIRGLAAEQVKVTRQDLRRGTVSPPLLFVDAMPETLRAKLKHIAMRPIDEIPFHIGRYRGVDVAWLAQPQH